MRYLTFALGKGRLANKTLEMFEKIGITCEEMKDKDTRKLIFVNEDLKLRFFLAKGPDVPTYVEYDTDISMVRQISELWERIRSWRKDAVSMRYWIWESANAGCVSAVRNLPEICCNIMSRSVWLPSIRRLPRIIFITKSIRPWKSSS